MIPKKSYKDLCEENKVLFEKAEECTMMMGFCLLQGRADMRLQYRNLRTEILQMVEVNLELIEAIWQKSIQQSLEDKHASYYEKNIIKIYQENKYYSNSYIATKAGCKVALVKSVIEKHLKSAS